MSALLRDSLQSLSLNSAIDSRIYALLEDDKFQEALKLATAEKAVPKLYIAYAQYRLGKEEECLKTLKAAEDRASRHLRAQALYRLERVAADDLSSLKHDTQVDNEVADIAVNEIAIAAQRACRSGAPSDIEVDTDQASHEYLFNYSIYLSSCGDVDSAIDVLHKATKTLESLQLDKEDHEAELAPIEAQLAHLTSSADLNAQAAAKNSDSSTKFLTNLNFFTSTNPFMTYKAHCAASTLRPSARLFTFQDCFVQYDRILAMYNIGLDIRKSVKRYIAQFSDKDPVRCTALRGLIYDQSTTKSLREMLKKDQNNVELVMVLIRKLLGHPKGVSKSLALIESLPDQIRQNNPGLIGVWCSLADSSSTSDSSAILTKALEHASGSSRIELLAGFVQRSIAKRSFTKEQAEDSTLSSHLQELLDLDPQNRIGLAAQSVLEGPKTANDIQLPDLSSINVAALEVGVKRQADDAWNIKPVKKQKVKTAEQIENEQKLDPERWLPKRDRSNYKLSKKEKQKGAGGHQGGLVDESLSNAGPAQANAKTSEVARKKKNKKTKK